MAAYEAAVIGATLDGLAAAAVLAQAGVKTALLERAQPPGGAFREAEIVSGFTAPVLRHDDENFPATLIAELGLSRHGVVVADLPGSVTITPEGPFSLPNDPHGAAAAVAALSPNDAEALATVRAGLQRAARRLKPILAGPAPRPLDRAGQPLRAWLQSFDSVGREFVMSARELVEIWFEHSRLREHVLMEGLAMTGRPADEPGTGAILLARWANGGLLGRGVRAVGGAPALIAALLAAIKEAGGLVRFDAEVLSIIMSGARVKGAALTSREMVDARAVISALDVKRTLLTLCDTQRFPSQTADAARRLRMAGRHAKVNLALARLPTFTGVPRRMLSGPILVALDPRTLTLDIRIPSLADPGRAPDGKHVMSILVEGDAVPAGVAWPPERRDALLAQVIRALESVAPGLAETITGARTVTPYDIENEYRLTGGDLLGGEMRPAQMWWNRPLPEFSACQSPVQGFLMCGEGVHPGPLMPGQGGANAAKALLARLRKR